MSNTHAVMVVTNKPNEPVTIDEDMFEGNEQQCQNTLLDILASMLINNPNPSSNTLSQHTVCLYWRDGSWVKLLIVPTTDIETK
jgi:hypothetical protein